MKIELSDAVPGELYKVVGRLDVEFHPYNSADYKDVNSKILIKEATGIFICRVRGAFYSFLVPKHGVVILCEGYHTIVSL